MGESEREVEELREAGLEWPANGHTSVSGDESTLSVAKRFSMMEKGRCGREVDEFDVGERPSPARCSATRERSDTLRPSAWPL